MLSQPPDQNTWSDFGETAARRSFCFKSAARLRGVIAAGAREHRTGLAFHFVREGRASWVLDGIERVGRCHDTLQPVATYRLRASETAKRGQP